MKEYINELLRKNNIVSANVDNTLFEDIIYQGYKATMELFSDELKNSKISEYQLDILLEYEECLEKMNTRVCDIAYMIGLKDAMLFTNAFKRK